MKYLYSLLLIIFLSTGVGNFYTASAAFDDGVLSTETQMDDGQLTGSGQSVRIDNPIKADNIIELFQKIIDIVMVFAVPLIVFFIIYAGFLYVTARGNEETIKKAHMALLYALIGGLLILGANVLIDIVQGTVDTIKN